MTITANTGVTLSGSAAIAAGASSIWILRKTGTATWVAYRRT
jgi:hypothetical protein